MKPNNNMKQKILETATKLITENGIKNTSLADISKSVGISKGTLYYYYSSKDDIIFDIADSHLNIITDAILNCVQNTKTDSPKDEIIKFIMEKISTIESTGRIHMYLICEAITGNEPLKERIKNQYIAWRTTLQSEVEKNFINNKDYAEALSFLLISIVDGFVVQSLLKTEKLPYKNIATFLINNWY